MRTVISDDSRRRKLFIHDICESLINFRVVKTMTSEILSIREYNSVKWKFRVTQ